MHLRSLVVVHLSDENRPEVINPGIGKRKALFALESWKVELDRQLRILKSALAPQYVVFFFHIQPQCVVPYTAVEFTTGLHDNIFH